LAQYKIGLASSSTLPFIKAALIKIGIADTFHELVSGESEPYGKPHPSIYLKTAKLLGLPLENCIAFEDSINGLRAAKAAGMYCIAIPEAVENLDPGFEAADHIFASLNEFRLSYLMV
jgi:sugar-phosphatase